MGPSGHSLGLPFHKEGANEAAMANSRGQNECGCIHGAEKQCLVAKVPLEVQGRFSWKLVVEGLRYPVVLSNNWDPFPNGRRGRVRKPIVEKGGDFLRKGVDSPKLQSPGQQSPSSGECMEGDLGEISTLESVAEEKGPLEAPARGSLGNEAPPLLEGCGDPEILGGQGRVRSSPETLPEVKGERERRPIRGCN